MHIIAGLEWLAVPHQHGITKILMSDPEVYTVDNSTFRHTVVNRFSMSVDSEWHLESMSSYAFRSGHVDMRIKE